MKRESSDAVCVMSQLNKVLGEKADGYLKALEETGSLDDVERVYYSLYPHGDAALDVDPYHWNEVLKIVKQRNSS